MSSNAKGSSSKRPPLHPSSAIAISDVDADDFSDTDPILYDASPGAGSYVEDSESWRPMPPPMLASSLDTNTRFRPHLSKREHRPPPASTQLAAQSTVQPTETVAYGSLEELELDTIAPDTAELVTPLLSAGAQPHRTRIDGIIPQSEQPPRRDFPHSPPTQAASFRSKFSRALAHARLLNEAPRELWLIYGLKFLSSYAYFSLSLVLTLFLTDEFGMSDTAAGWAYGAYGVMSTFFGLLCGWFIDYLGVRASLLLGALIGAVARFVMAVTSSQHTAILMLYTFLPFAECLGIPIMTIGIKRYTNARNRTFAFSLFYSMMNVAALCVGPFVDIARTFAGDGFTLNLHPLGSLRLSGLRLIILSSSIATAAMCCVVVFGIREIDVDDHGNLREFTPNREGPISQTMRVLREKEFWRLSLFTLLLVMVRLVFRHLDATMPKYLTRQFGPDAPFGLVYSINPFLIIFLVPMVGILTRKVDSFSMILGGSFVSAASPFWVCLKQSYLCVVMFMVTLSIGEAIYSPRVYEYTMEVSPHGSEGIYSSLSAAPLFSVKLLVGGMSGWLLTSFMPAEGPHHGAILWGIIGLTSMISPVCMCLLRECIRPSSRAEEIPMTTQTVPDNEDFSKSTGKIVSATPIPDQEERS